MFFIFFLPNQYLRHSLDVNNCFGHPIMTKQCSLPAQTHRQNTVSIVHLTSTKTIVRIFICTDWKHAITSSQQTKCTTCKETNPRTSVIVNILTNQMVYVLLWLHLLTRLIGKHYFMALAFNHAHP